ncbi:zinc ABC transporter substrate-binding protein [Neiella sp. HB171785]|uniref:Zinc ABC transporter substrate-binding protein n=1 Tax=Neiella litorisoli TaxID=2771431 RepID=A0A8J6QMF9_9GAMM|nr:zinc ABC transporter substrate-binding protein [Neiella litorisoli]MBD1390866.1 zinc ABC transporter substrate-binding protein [Neiella litorisoli]
MVRTCSKMWAVALTVLLSAAAPARALNIFACEPEWASLAKELAPEADIYSATTAYQDPHYVQARPSLIAKLRRADLFVCSGSELEIGWLPALQMRANNSKVRDGQPGAFYAAEQVERLDVLGKVDRSMGDVHGGGNPHVHWSPTRIEQIAKALTQRLIVIEPANAERYQQQLASFLQRWQTQREQWAAQASSLNGVQVVSYHTSYRYLYDWLGIEQVGDLEPKPGLPPTSGHLASLVSLHKQKPYQLIIYASYQDGKAANWLSSKTGTAVLGLPYSVDPNKEQLVDLFGLYQTAIDQLLAAVAADG